MSVVNSTRETRSNFIVISEALVAFEGMKPRVLVSGEFHSGVHHRMEDPDNRVVANCETREGHQFFKPDLSMNSGPEIAGGACGIGPYSADATVAFMGEIETKFGTASRVQITDAKFQRTYDVMPNGAIVRNEWRLQGADGAVAFKAEAKHYCKKRLPKSAFAKASLGNSFLRGSCP